MTKNIAGLLLLALASSGCEKPPPPRAPETAARAETTNTKVASERHRIVFELTADDREQWEKLLTNVENARRALGPEKSDVVIIAHGGGLSMLLATNADLSARMAELARAGVVFAACENTMKKKNVSKEDLLPFATSVDSGVAEIVRRQEAGWAYIRSTK